MWGEPPAPALTHNIQLVGVVDAAILVLHDAGVVALIRWHHRVHDDAPGCLADLGGHRASYLQPAEPQALLVFNPWHGQDINLPLRAPCPSLQRGCNCSQLSQEGQEAQSHTEPAVLSRCCPWAGGDTLPGGPCVCREQSSFVPPARAASLAGPGGQTLLVPMGSGV